MAASARRKRTSDNIPDWLPDWRDDSQYPHPKTTPLKQWAWEFLRRNPAYQKQWQETIEPWRRPDGNFDNKGAIEAKTRQFSQTTEYQEKWKKHQENWPEIAKARNLKEAVQAYTILENNPEYMASLNALTITDPVAELQSNFGFYSIVLLPPSIPSNALPMHVTFHASLKGTRSIMKTIYPSDKTAAFEPPIEIDWLKKNEILVCFDLELPIETQIKNAKEYLKTLRKQLSDMGVIKIKNPRNHIELFQRYLRVLDGKDRGIPEIKLLECIFPDKVDIEIVKYAVKTAEYLRNEGYRFIDKIE